MNFKNLSRIVDSRKITDAVGNFDSGIAAPVKWTEKETDSILEGGDFNESVLLTEEEWNEVMPQLTTDNLVNTTGGIILIPTRGLSEAVMFEADGHFILGGFHSWIQEVTMNDAMYYATDWNA